MQYNASVNDVILHFYTRIKVRRQQATVALNRRIALGAITMFFLLVITDGLETANLIPVFRMVPGTEDGASYNMFFLTFLAAGIGAYIAREKFLVPAMLVICGYWLLNIGFLYRVVYQTTYFSIKDFALYGLSHLLIVAVAGVLGAQIGFWLYMKNRNRVEGAS